MLAKLALELGPWSWWVAGLVLLAAELAVPGVFLVWIGLGAIATGVLSLLLWGADLWSWQVQLLVFAALSVVSILIGRKFLASGSSTTDEPFLNQRGASLVGRTATLQEAIVNGRGRIHLDDTTWSVIGPDTAAGSTVRIMESKGRELRVEPVRAA
ncbi:NfeD family protein [Rhizobium halophytocola]|uniref:Membrane protein implicated in regulation of membrane protease activity n=1 Tax=Rhizobium halophytocola TaxID=735519 RepID=A0ABS4DT99_9HYPH|nr:NfeD family protein [Rhizobium halophytocola]MBP1848924.1 membrane protein implicated in regulation of membrane protease activity [Rhizobium halophytocola]